MALMDDIIKWFKKPKTLYGIVGMIGIVILLAADFAYWAGAITVEDPNAEVVGEEEEEKLNWTLQLDIDDTHQGTLPIPSMGIIISEGNSVESHEFEVVEGTYLGFVNVTFEGTKARPDFDLRVYGPGDKKVGESATEGTDEYIKLEEKDFNRTGYGTYRAEVENYSSFNIDYTLTIQTYIKVPKEGTDEDEGE